MWAQADAVMLPTAVAGHGRRAFNVLRRAGGFCRVAAVLALGGALAAVSAAPVAASGFALREQSATGIGNAFAGATAGAEDITFMFFNPAGLTRHSGNQIVGVGSLILPRTHFEYVSGTTAAGIPIGGGDGGKDAAVDAFVPAAYALWDVHPRLKLALAVNVPFGLETDYDDGWVGRYHGLRSRLRTATVTPTAAYQINDMFSVGAGLQVQYIDAKLTSAIDFGSAGAAVGIPTALPTQQDGLVDLKGSDIGIGFTLGLLFEPWTGTRLGVGYRSAIHHTFDGDADFELDNAGIGAALSAASGRFVDTGISVDLTTPDSLSFGAYHEIGERWAVMAEAAWTNWSRFRELRVQFDNPAEPDSVTREDWRDTWFFAAGATFRLSEKWTLRSGIAYDQSPIPADRRTPRIPSNDRTWISLGASYQPMQRLSIGFGYTHIFLKDGEVELSVSDPGNLTRGSLTGKTASSIDILAAQVSWQF